MNSQQNLILVILLITMGGVFGQMWEGNPDENMTSTENIYIPYNGINVTDGISARVDGSTYTYYAILNTDTPNVTTTFAKIDNYTNAMWVKKFTIGDTLGSLHINENETSLYYAPGGNFERVYEISTANGLMSRVHDVLYDSNSTYRAVNFTIDPVKNYIYTAGWNSNQYETLCVGYNLGDSLSWGVNNHFTKPLALEHMNDREAFVVRQSVTDNSNLYFTRLNFTTMTPQWSYNLIQNTMGKTNAKRKVAVTYDNDTDVIYTFSRYIIEEGLYQTVNGTTGEPIHRVLISNSVTSVNGITGTDAHTFILLEHMDDTKHLVVLNKTTGDFIDEYEVPRTTTEITSYGNELILTYSHYDQLVVIQNKNGFDMLFYQNEIDTSSVFTVQNYTGTSYTYGSITYPTPTIHESMKYFSPVQNSSGSMFSSYDNDISFYNLGGEINKTLEYFEYPVFIDLPLTCKTATIDTTYSMVASEGEELPQWVQISTETGELVVVTPEESQNKTYTFKIAYSMDNKTVEEQTTVNLFVSESVSDSEEVEPKPKVVESGSDENSCYGLPINTKHCEIDEEILEYAIGGLVLLAVLIGLYCLLKKCCCKNSSNVVLVKA